MNILRTIVTGALLSVLSAWPSQAQEAVETQGKRVPSNILRPEQAGILLSENRVQTEQPEKTLDALNLQDGDLVADIGCGNGFYTLRLAERVGPRGLVFAEDIQQGMIDLMLERAKEAQIRNIYPVLGTFDDTMLPPGRMDWMLLVDVYHEFSDPQAMLAVLKGGLAPDGRVALLEYRAEQTDDLMPAFIPRSHKMTVEEVMGEWTPAGFELVERLEFLPAQHLFIFKVAGSDGARGGWDHSAPINVVKIGETSNGSALGDTVYFGGQPAEADFNILAEKGVRTVINLRTQGEMDQLGFDEKAAVEGAGMAYEHLPIGGDALEDGAIFRMLEILRRNEAQGNRVLIHCRSSNRVGFLWTMYLGARKGFNADDAAAKGNAAGMKAETLEERARAFLKRRIGE